MLIEVDSAARERLTRAELDVIRFINDNEAQLAELSIGDVAMETYSSPAGVVRALRKCGVSDFHELRYKATAVAADPAVRRMGEVINSSLLEVQRLVDLLSVPVLLNAVETIRAAERIVVLGRGLTAHVATELALKLQRLGYVAVAGEPEAMRPKTRRMKPTELLLIFSLNGRSPSLVEAAQSANRCDAKVITCCCDAGSPLLPLSDLVIVGHRQHHDDADGHDVDSRLPLQVISRLLVEALMKNA